MPAKANRLTKLSIHPPGFIAAAMPRMKASSTESTKLASINLQVTQRAGPSTSSTGWAWVRENPKSPCRAATSQCQ